MVSMGMRMQQDIMTIHHKSPNDSANEQALGEELHLASVVLFLGVFVKGQPMVERRVQVGLETCPGLPRRESERPR